MKYLKTYKLYESKSSKLLTVKKICKEKLIYLIDDGLDIAFEREGKYLFLSFDNDKKDFMKWNDIKDDILSLFETLIEYKVISLSTFITFRYYTPGELDSEDLKLKEILDDNFIMKKDISGFTLSIKIKNIKRFEQFINENVNNPDSYLDSKMQEIKDMIGTIENGTSLIYDWENKNDHELYINFSKDDLSIRYEFDIDDLKLTKIAGGATDFQTAVDSMDAGINMIESDINSILGVNESVFNIFKNKNNDKVIKFDIDNYIQIDRDLNTTIVTSSESYGDYIVTRIATIDCIKACEDGFLSEVYNISSSFRVGEDLATTRTITLAKKLFGGENGQYLKKYELYTALKEDNKDWIDPKGYLESLPVAISKKILNKIMIKRFKDINPLKVLVKIEDRKTNKPSEFIEVINEYDNDEVMGYNCPPLQDS